MNGATPAPAAASAATTPGRIASRPRVGRPSLPVSGLVLSEPAPPLSELLVGSGSAAPSRAASATVQRPSAAFAKSSSRSKASRATADSSTPLAHLYQTLSLGSDTGLLLTTAAGAAGSARQRQRCVNTSLSSQIRSTAPLAADADFAPAVSGFARAEATPALDGGDGVRG